MYPTNYDFLSEEKQKRIIKYMNSLSESYNTALEFTKTLNGVPELYRRYSEGVRNIDKQIRDIRFAYSLAGIYLEYNWPGHDGWFLVTQEDIDYYEEYMFKCMEG